MAISDDTAAKVGNFDTAAIPDVKRAMAAVADASNSASVAQAAFAGSLQTMAFLLPDAATATYLYTVPEKIEIVDVVCIKDAAGAANTVQLKNGSGTAISDAIATAVDKTVTRAGTLDKATRVLAAAAQLQITNTRAAGSSACAVFVHYIRRA